MNEKFLIYEAHVPYKLQFLIDNNLYGMDQMNLKEVQFRYPLPSNKNNQIEDSFGFYKETVEEKLILPPKILKISNSPVEMDVDFNGLLFSIF